MKIGAGVTINAASRGEWTRMNSIEEKDNFHKSF